MPYIPQGDRKKYEPWLGELREAMSIRTPKGDLTYLVYALALEFWKEKGASYTSISEAIGALNDAAEEMRRRHLAPYENKKIEENGDVI